MKKLKRVNKIVERADELNGHHVNGHHGWGDERKCWGRPQATYIFRRRSNGASRFLKVGEYCAKCGGLLIYRAFKGGINYEAAKLIDAPAGNNSKPIAKLAGRLRGGK